MEVVFYFLGFGVAILFMILQFDKQQNRRLNKILKETKNVQPLFLLRSADQKLRTLNTLVYGNLTMNADAPSGRTQMDEGARQFVAAQLSKVVSDYNSGQIAIKEYNSKLSELVTMVNQVKGMSFEQIKG